jgi:uncharacterized protein YodC (DUF2158 family)
MAIQSGTLVWLKSGGPKMTVKSHQSNGWICTWFLNLEPKEHVFNENQLVEEEPGR